MKPTNYAHKNTSRVDVLLEHEDRRLLTRLQEHLHAKGYKLSLASVLRLGLKTLAHQEGLDV